MKSEDVAFARLAAIGPSAAEKARDDEVQRGIDATMREVIRGAKYNPNALDAPMVKVVPQGAVKVAEDPRPSLLPGVPTEPVKPRLRDWIREGEPKPKPEEGVLMGPEEPEA
jgi:hypothetical protein